MLESVMHKLIPGKVSTFAKLLGQGAPYHFDRWETDRAGSQCLYYWFMARDGGKNKKRVPVSEIRAALHQLRGNGVLSREAFRDVCPVAARGGPCGFAVVGRIFEALHVAVYSGQNGFRITNAADASNLLSKQ